MSSKSEGKNENKLWAITKTEEWQGKELEKEERRTQNWSPNPSPSPSISRASPSTFPCRILDPYL